MQLKRQIEEMLKAGKLSHLIKESKQKNDKDQTKVAKKGEAVGKDKPLAILMVQAGRKIAKQRITQTFFPETMISFPPLGEEDGMEGPMVIEVEEIRNQMVPATTYLAGFSGERIWPLGQIAFFMQRNNRKARCKENQSKPIHSPQNVEVPSDRRNGHTAE
ncbi:hypothetical protein Tco_0191862 [Tanacetum coccineum]